MAEAVIGSIAADVISNLVARVLGKVGNLWGLKQEIEMLRDTVPTLRTVLAHAEEQYYHNPEIKLRLEKLKDAFYEAHDVLEELNIEAMRRELRGHNEVIKEVRTFFSSSNQLAFNLKMSRKVRAVRERIESIKADRGFHLEERPVDSRVEGQWREREETYSFIREGHIKGRDDDKETVRNFFLDSDMKESVSILPIVGVGGLGKTCLAQSVYNDETVSKQFDLKMWICVSNHFDVKKIVKNMIACAKKNEPTGDAMELLQSKFREEIDGKKYLLVLDDVWNTDQDKWRRLKTLLEEGAGGSKILITTRIPLVAEITGTVRPHFLRGLSESASLDLLMQMAGKKIEEIQDSDMLAIGKEIVKKCSGVPLVVRTVGSLLFRKKTHPEWLRFKDQELPEVCRDEERIMSVLKLSYDHLPSHLKQCFAFCSLFPKDYEIRKQTLVDLWVAEGFIQPSNRGRDLEGIAHEYFMDLLWSNFLQDFKKDPITKEEICKMHDLMHDLACSVAGIECWGGWDDTKSIHERTRHISHDSTSNLMGKLPILKTGALRTFLFVSSIGTYCERRWEREREMSEKSLCQLIQSCKRLRILVLHATRFEKEPRSICKLKHLTYLDLSNNRVLKRLPNSITRLQNLQTLNLHRCFSLEELPRGIRKLVSLRNLDIDGCKRLRYLPRGLGQLSSLHRLTHFILPKDKALAKNYCGLGELNGLNNVRGSLTIKNLGSVTDAVEECKAANLTGKSSLKSLKLKWGDFDTNDTVIGDRDKALLDGLRPHSNLQELTIHGYKGESFPSWMRDGSSLPNLVRLRLQACGRLKCLPQFGLNKVKTLQIWDMEFLECLPEKCLKGFASLECLHIWRCPRLTSLSSLGLGHLSKLAGIYISGCSELNLSEEDESGSNILDFHGELFNSLRSVTISNLPKLKSLPQWLLQASNLERLVIYECRNLKELPEQIGDLQSLQQLVIKWCRWLTSLPEGVGRLASLTDLIMWVAQN